MSVGYDLSSITHVIKTGGPVFRDIEFFMVPETWVTMDFDMIRNYDPPMNSCIEDYEYENEYELEDCLFNLLKEWKLIIHYDMLTAIQGASILLCGPRPADWADTGMVKRIS